MKTTKKHYTLSPCTNRPNCVSSQSLDTTHYIKPIRFPGSPADAWVVLKFSLLALPRTRIVKETGWYLHAEARSLFFGFIDDIEFLMDVKSGTIHLRSGARIGYSDLGVNRKRIEQIREAFGS